MANDNFTLPSSSFYCNCNEPSRDKYDRLKWFQPYWIKIIRSQIMEQTNSLQWDDIAGPESVKSIIQESIVYPLIRPDLFTGLRSVPKAILLFGLPRTGKRLIGKCIAAQSKSTFFYLNLLRLSPLVSSNNAELQDQVEEFVKTLYAVAAVHQPSVIFFDDIDSILTTKNDKEMDITRRLKVAFITRLESAPENSDKILFVGATSRPQDLDKAVLPFFVKRFYIPLPELKARKRLVNHFLKNEKHKLNDDDLSVIAVMTEKFTGADIKNLCQFAATRCISVEQMDAIQSDDIRSIEIEDFVTSMDEAIRIVRPFQSNDDVTAMFSWNDTHGTFADVTQADF